MSSLTIFLLCAALAYLLGAIPFGYLIARARGVNIRRVGSGNIGATNVFRTVGSAWGILTFVLDAAKGFVAAFFLPALAAPAYPAGPDPWLPVVCACCAVAGHNWPVYLQFKGGKGVATGAGALLGIAWQALVIGLLSWSAVLLLTGYVSAASMLAALILALSSWLLYSDKGLPIPAALTLLAVLTIWRHKANIARLLRGTENRVRFRRPGSGRTGQDADNS